MNISNKYLITIQIFFSLFRFTTNFKYKVNHVVQMYHDQQYGFCEIKYQNVYPYKLPFLEKSFIDKMKFCLKNVIKYDESTCVKVWLSHLKLSLWKDSGISAFHYWVLYINGDIMIIDVPYEDLEDNYSCMLLYTYFELRLKFNIVDFPKIFFIQDFNENSNIKLYSFYQETDIYPFFCPSKFNICNIFKEEAEEILNRLVSIKKRKPAFEEVHQVVCSIQKKYCYESLKKQFSMHIDTISKLFDE